MFNSLSLTNADHVVFNTVQSTFLQIIAPIPGSIDGPFQMQLGSSSTHSLTHILAFTQLTTLLTTHSGSANRNCCLAKWYAVFRESKAHLEKYLIFCYKA